MHSDSDQEAAFLRAFAEGTREAIEAWVALGPSSVERLRLELSGERRTPGPSGTFQRDLLDNLGSMSHAAASQLPDAFLEAFENAEWDQSTTVVAGLGAIKRPETTHRLMRLLQSGDQWVRIAAAVALEGHRVRGLDSVLLTALDDPNDLVRYHVEARLRELEAGR